MKLPFKKIILIAAAAVLVFAPLAITVHAQATNTPPATGSGGAATNGPTTNAGASASQTPQSPPGFLSCMFSPSSNIATCSVYYVEYIANSIISLVIEVGAFLVRLGLQLNDFVFQSPAVQTGFSITLSLANLGFVLGIIIIAIATILRNQTYGIKQLLWKLVFMAILINFGLVITGPIVGFANGLTTYFLNAITGGPDAGHEVFARMITQSFAPQALQLAGAQATNNANGGTGGAATPPAAGTTYGVVYGTCSALAGALPGGAGLDSLCNLAANKAQVIANSPPDSIVQQTLAMFFTIIFSSLIAFTLLALAALLIIRYLMLAGLLIVLPLAWLMFIFPKFDNSYSKWWNTFVKWTFFPPLAMFFLYLALLTATNTPSNTYLSQAIAMPSNAAAGPEGGIVQQAGIVVAQTADEVLLIGLTVMGLMFASSLAGKAGSTVVSIGTNTSKAIGGYVGKQGKKGARAAARAAKVPEAVQGLRSGLGGLQKVRGLGWAATRASSLVGRAVEPALSNRSYVDNAKKKVSDNPEEIKQNLKGNMNMEDTFAHIEKLIEKGKLTDDTMVSGMKVGQFLDKHKDGAVKTYGFTKNIDDADKMIGNNGAMRGAKDDLDKAEKSGVGIEEANKKLVEATNAFVDTLQKSDMSKMSTNDIFKKDSKHPFAGVLAASLATNGAHLASSAMPKMKSATLENFQKVYGSEIQKGITSSPKLSEMSQLDAEIQNLKNSVEHPSPEIAKNEQKKRGLTIAIEEYNAKPSLTASEQDLLNSKKAELAATESELKILNLKNAGEVQNLKEQIATKTSRKKVVEDSLSKPEKNILSAKDSLKKSIAVNQIGGHEDHSDSSGGGHGGGGGTNDH